jgi:hypothetical protein
MVTIFYRESPTYLSSVPDKKALRKALTTKEPTFGQVNFYRAS